MGHTYQTTTKKNAITIAGLRKIKQYIPVHLRRPIYHSLFTANVHYLINVWSDTTKKNIHILQRQKNKILKLIYNMKRETPTREIYEKTHELTIQQMIEMKNLLHIHIIEAKKIKTNLKLKTNKQVHNYQTRRRSHIRTYRAIRKENTQELTSEAVRAYNELPKDMKQLNIQKFKLALRERITKGKN